MYFIVNDIEQEVIHTCFVSAERYVSLLEALLGYARPQALDLGRVSVPTLESFLASRRGRLLPHYPLSGDNAFDCGDGHTEKLVDELGKRAHPANGEGSKRGIVRACFNGTAREASMTLPVLKKLVVGQNRSHKGKRRVKEASERGEVVIKQPQLRTPK